MKISIYDVLHFVAGAIAALSALVCWGLPIALTTIFCIYEIWESKILHDKAYIDLLGFLLGAFITSGILVGLQIGGIL